jgi:hypothetical protein
MKLLLIGHVCSPHSGSEPSFTWNWAWHLSRNHDVWVLAHPHDRTNIERFLAQCPNPRLAFHWVSVPRWIDPFTLIQVLAPMATPIVALETPLSEYRVHGDNLAGVSRFTETRLRNIVSYEREIWMAWRRYLASPCSGLPSNFPLPSMMAPSLMDYANARFRSDKNSRAIYRAIPRTYLQTLPKPHQLYWQVSIFLPGWLFRRSFDFVYGQTHLKMIARRILRACRRSAWLGKWMRRRKSPRAETTRRLPSAASAKSPSGF